MYITESSGEFSIFFFFFLEGFENVWLTSKKKKSKSNLSKFFLSERMLFTRNPRKYTTV